MAAAVAPYLPPFNDLIADAITDHSQISSEQLIVLDNSAKYAPGGIKQDVTDEKTLSEIFGTMATLNRTALESSSLCAGEHGPCFRDALFRATSELGVLAKGRPVRYVELGPEPWKSRAILKQLLAAGVQLRQYIGVDINPESEEAMRQALVPVIGAERFTYWIMDFYKCTVKDFPEPTGDIGAQDDCITIVTNLGFQEGNDLPSRTGPMLKRLTRPGDLLLSEMQVFYASKGRDGGPREAGAASIEQFYQLPEMRRFSLLVGQQFNSASPPETSAASNGEQSEYLFKLVPLQTEVGSVNVATTLVSVENNGDKKYVLTNSCLKYTPDQFQQAREASGDFVVVVSQETGDKSVIFQISERR
ncbi:MAG: hypothetical protein MMC33_010701 [Icmadophila ericetorum]|nr:hypothetical protein [Icmadophila ericetorum]